MRIITSMIKSHRLAQQASWRYSSSMASSGALQQSNDQNLKSDVIKLYKNLIYLSREWPTDLRPQIRKAFLANRDVSEPDKIRELIARGEYVSREITATYHLKKYRAMKRRYYSDVREKELDDMFKEFTSSFEPTRQ